MSGQCLVGGCTCSLYADEGEAWVQVYDLQQYRPAPVLRQIWANFAAQKRQGDPHAETVQR